MKGDCLERMKEIPDGSIKLIITDPPYRMTKRGKSCRPNWMPDNMGENVFNGKAPPFKDWLSMAFPDRAQKVWNLISDCHGGAVNDSRIGTRMKGEGNIADIIYQQFQLYCKQFGLFQQQKL